MKSSNKYWKGIDELDQSTDFVSSQENEFSEGLPLEKIFTSDDDSIRANRRDFLKYFGFSVGAVTLAACNKAPVKKAVPYVVKPENVTPGVPLYYAGSSVSNSEGYPMLVKVREGRPIKFEPNKEATFFGGGLDGLAHSAILSLYDTNRLKGAMLAGDRTPVAWADFDKNVIKALDATTASGKSIAIVTNSNTSLVVDQAIKDFSAKYNNTETISYEPISYSGIIEANKKSFGEEKGVIPSYNFKNANVIVSFGADFLGTWISPMKFQADYSKNRVPKEGVMSKHYQFESLMSLTGTNADHRAPMKMSNVGQHLIALYRELGGATPEKGMELAGNAIKESAAALKAANGKSLVVCGSNDINDQMLVNKINMMLGNYGSTIDLTNYYMGQSASDSKFNQFIQDAKGGKYGAAIFVNCNPVYSHPGAKDAIAKIGTRISTAITMDETATACTHVATDLHPLESWDIKQPYKGKYVFAQPTISPVFEGRHVADTLLAWTGANVEDSEELTHAYHYTKSVFTNAIGGDFNKAIENGFIDNGGSGSVPADGIIADECIAAIKSRKATTSDLIIYQKVGVRDGAYGNTPWAHEMPDPVTKVTWDNYLTVSMPDAEANKWVDGDIMTITAGNGKVEKLPMLIQPGQAKGTYGIALGFGRILPDSVKNDLKDLGKNAYPLVARSKEGRASYIVANPTIEKVDSGYEFGRTQTHNSIEGRDIVREASLDAYNKDNTAGNVFHKPAAISLWDSHDYSKGHHWAMAIDLNKCTGCSACIVSCSIENNVPVVGRDEVRRRREMHWLRIDRYYSFEVPTDQDLSMSIVNGGDKSLKSGEYMTQEKVMEAYTEATDSTDYYQNVKVVHQPMLCQHCDNAPCETVCPVLATTHSSEGLNQMTYNRCIGTKYCGNNCPYKVRRFNWFRYNENEKFDYHFSNDLGKMVINPDVTVRSRGVMEKCSFCVQRIQTAKLTAKRDNRKMNTDEFTVACAQTCPSNAIVFGDLNDSKSEVSKLYGNDRGFHVIEELGTKPSIKYLTKIRNKKETTNTKAH